MASGIAGDGVPGAGAGAGSVFRDVSFWVARRIPMRSAILDKIKRNGGTVVPREKDADILIADHARKDVPPGSYSWKLVTESVEHGIMQIKDRYHIGPKPTPPRPAGSSLPGKTSRTAFSHEDDVALVKWVFSHDKHQAGNKIYQDFAQENTRHPWQSWRDRFHKALLPRGQAYLQQLAGKASSQPPEPAERAQQKPARAEPDTTLLSAMPDASPIAKDGEPQSRDHDSPSPAPSSPAARVATQALATPSETAALHGPREQSPLARETEDESEVTMEAMKRIFIDDIVAYAAEANKAIELEASIGGRPVSLWELNQAVEAQNVHRDEVDWPKVAEDLGLELGPQVDLPAELCRCYRDNLVDFLDKMSNLESENEGSLDDGSLPATAPLHVQSPDSCLSSSPPALTAGRKRSLGEEAPGSGFGPKRRRLDPDAEVPSTPEEDMHYSRRPPARRTSSLSVHGIMANHGQPQRTPRSNKLPSLSGDEDEEPARETRVGPPPPPPAQEGSVEVTPSQQLRSEALDVSPIPLDLKGNAHAEGRRRALPPTWTRSAASPPATAPRSPRRSQPAGVSGTGARNGSLTGIRYWVEHYQAMGYPHRLVVEAMKRTTMTPGDCAVAVMDHLQDGRAVPHNLQGVWTDRDDDALRLLNATKLAEGPADARASGKARRSWERLVHKHTLEGVELRRKYLAVQDASDALS